MNQYSILVNTCDKFEDCWDPFFKLFSIYWPDYKGKIYLNTEYKNYTYGELNIIPLKVAEEKQDGHLITWSECLIRALNKIDTDFVLYMQEDYFLKDNVKNDIVNEYAQLMSKHEDIACIHLTDQGLISKESEQKYKGLNPVKLNQRYRVSCQAALWKKEILFKHLRSYENAWEFEEFGSQRSAIYNDDFYSVDKNWIKLNHFEIIPYVFTGIIQGRWFEEIIPLFKKHNIDMDYSIRGFVNDRQSKPFKNRVEYRLKKIPKILKNQIELLKLKSSNK
ncbi:hypothetical protein [Algibacter sp. L4_22]|uniref:hypothetical protein n=1 Tax=Algibacter sp. L4_22 TaxID=2942477 RepID=UPI00201B76BE|nr:hypothetical protein [Algibacter sp. L4_22]MCL5129858.1 hypothetical protein [Algibacter sp. L4_22]